MKNEKIIIFSIILSSILPLLDGSIVNIILPQLSQSFLGAEKHIQWIISFYFIFSVAGLLISPAFQSKVGIKSTWNIANFLFLFSSLFVGISENFSQLIVFRALQGFAAGMLLPLIQTVIIAEFGKENARQIMGKVAIPTVFVPAIAPLIGSFFTEYLSWRYLFLINIPVCLASIGISLKYFTCQNKEQRQFNVSLFLFGAVSLCWFFLSAENIAHHFSLENSILALIGLVLIMSSFYWNKKTSHRIIDLSGFSNLFYSSSILLGGVTSFLFYSFMIFFPFVDQNLNLIIIGLLLGFQGVGAAIGRKYLYKKLNDASPFMIIFMGIVISCFSLFFFYFSPIFQGIGFFVRGIGLGIATIVCLSSPFEWADKNIVKDTSVIIRIVQQLGGAIAAIFVGILIHQSSLSVNENYSLYIGISILTALYAFLIYRRAK